MYTSHGKTEKENRNRDVKKIDMSYGAKLGDIVRSIKK